MNWDKASASFAVFVCTFGFEFCSIWRVDLASSHPLFLYNKTAGLWTANTAKLYRVKRNGTLQAKDCPNSKPYSKESLCAPLLLCWKCFYFAESKYSYISGKRLIYLDTLQFRASSTFAAALVVHFIYWLHRQTLSAADTTQTTCFGGKRLWWTSTAHVKTSCAKECKWPGYLWQAECLVLCKAVQSVSSLSVALEKHEVISSAICDSALTKSYFVNPFPS